VGYYIVEFEQLGEDRAKDGEKLLKTLAKRLNRRGFGERRLYEFRLTYIVYPQIGPVIANYIVNNNKDDILRLPTAKLQLNDNLEEEKLRLPTAKSDEEWQTPAERLFYRLSATHLVLLSNLKDPLKRFSTSRRPFGDAGRLRKLDRQVSSQYYERMGLSKDKKALQRLTANNAQQLAPRDIIHNLVTLEFLDLPSHDVVTESKLENTILNHLQMVLMEMGRGFCF